MVKVVIFCFVTRGCYQLNKALDAFQNRSLIDPLEGKFDYFSKS